MQFNANFAAGPFADDAGALWVLEVGSAAREHAKRGVALRAAALEVRLEIQAAAVKALGPRNAKRLQEDLKTLSAVISQIAE